MLKLCLLPTVLYDTMPYIGVQCIVMLFNFEKVCDYY